MRDYITHSAEETRELGKNLAQRLALRLHLRQGVTLATVSALYGELGSGKTTFVQGLAEGLGITKRIISPTFVIIRQYKISPPRSPFGLPRCEAGHLGNTFYHVDLYRVEGKRGIEGLGLEEIISGPQNIVIIEWAEKMGNILPKERIDVWFEYVDEQKRRIIFNIL